MPLNNDKSSASGVHSSKTIPGTLPGWRYILPHLYSTNTTYTRHCAEPHYNATSCSKHSLPGGVLSSQPQWWPLQFKGRIPVGELVQDDKEEDPREVYATGRSAYYVRIPAITCRGDRSSQGQHWVTFLTFLKLFKFLCHCHQLLFLNLPSSPPTSLNPVILVSSDFLQFSSSQSALRVPWGNGSNASQGVFSRPAASASSGNVSEWFRPYSTHAKSDPGYRWGQQELKTSRWCGCLFNSGNYWFKGVLTVLYLTQGKIEHNGLLPGLSDLCPVKAAIPSAVCGIQREAPFQPQLHHNLSMDSQYRPAHFWGWSSPLQPEAVNPEISSP